MPDTSLLSDKNIPVKDRLILPLDVESADEARRVVNQLGESVSFYKLGLELFMTGHYFSLLEWLTEQNKQVFVDLKFFDVPRTVSAAVRQMHGLNAAFATVHGNDAILEAACEAKADTKILAVTVLTSLDQKDIEQLGFKVDVSALVLSRAERALAIGCDGVISSGHESRALRNSLGAKFLVVVPGIRPVANTDDQKRTVDVEEAFVNGADYIVVGRPILQAANPRQAAEDIQRRISIVFDRRDNG